MEEVLFESEQRSTRADVAEMFRTVADRLEAGEPITLSSGEGEVTLAVPERPTFEVKAEREVDGEERELSLEFELEWDENGESGDGSLTIG